MTVIWFVLQIWDEAKVKGTTKLVLFMLSIWDEGQLSFTQSLLAAMLEAFTTNTRVRNLISSEDYSKMHSHPIKF